MNKLKNSFGFRFECGFHHQTSARIPNRRRDRCLVHIQPNILGIVYLDLDDHFRIAKNSSSQKPSMEFAGIVLRCLEFCGAPGF
jgi:hypothetical protein